MLSATVGVVAQPLDRRVGSSYLSGQGGVWKPNPCVLEHFQELYTISKRNVSSEYRLEMRFALGPSRTTCRSNTKPIKIDLICEFTSLQLYSNIIDLATYQIQHSTSQNSHTVLNELLVALSSSVFVFLSQSIQIKRGPHLFPAAFHTIDECQS